MSDDYITPEAPISSKTNKKAESSLKKIIAFGVLAIIATGGISLYLVQIKGAGEIPLGISITKAIIPVDHYFENGVHTYKGTLTVPTPCHDIISTVTVMESYPEQVSISLKREGASNFCAQVVSQTPFEVTFQASKEARVSLSIDGELVLLKVTERKETNPLNLPSKEATSTENDIFDDSFLYEGSGV